MGDTGGIAVQIRDCEMCHAPATLILCRCQAERRDGLAAKLATAERQRDELLAALDSMLSIIFDAVSRGDVVLETREEISIRDARASLASIETGKEPPHGR